MEITKSQIAAIHTLLRKLNLYDDKVKLVQEISNGRCSSTTQLTWTEAQQWITAMNKGVPRQETAGEEKQKKQRMINAIIAMAWEMGAIQKKTVLTIEDGIKEKNDYTKLNEWMTAGSYLKKPLNQYAYNELPKLVTQYKNIYQSWLTKKREQ